MSVPMVKALMVIIDSTWTTSLLFCDPNNVSFNYDHFKARIREPESFYNLSTDKMADVLLKAAEFYRNNFFSNLK